MPQVSIASGKVAKLRPGHKYFGLVVILSLCVLSLVSCQHERDVAFASLIPVNHPNKEVTLSLFTNPDNIHPDSSIHLLLENRSQNYISFPTDFGLRIFAYLDEEMVWVEVENSITYLPPDKPIVLASKGEVPFNQTVLRVWPVMINAVDAAYLRIMVSGNVLKENGPTDQQVAAFIEVELKP